MISLNTVSDKSIWQQLLPCKYQNPVTDGRHGAWGQRGQAVPGKPPTFSSASLSLPPFYPKGLEFPITIPGFLPTEERFSLTPLQLGSSCKCLGPRSHSLRPPPTTPAPCQILQGLQQAAVGLEKAKTMRLAQQCKRGVDGADQSLSPLPVLLYRTPFLIQILPVSFR